MTYSISSLSSSFSSASNLVVGGVHHVDDPLGLALHPLHAPLPVVVVREHPGVGPGPPGHHGGHWDIGSALAIWSEKTEASVNEYVIQTLIIDTHWHRINNEHFRVFISSYVCILRETVSQG